VPFFLYGPGSIPAVGRIDRPATVADLAPTLAEHMDFPFTAPDGTALPEASVPTGGGGRPRLVVVVVWDGLGRNVLAR
jgi:arylsulfatase A-like enzyme